MSGRHHSTAVMARRVEPPDSLDFFPTPPWGTRALCEHVLPALGRPDNPLAGSAWDPACGEGHMALAMEEYFPLVHASDIFDYGYGTVADFLHPDFAPPFLRRDGVDWIVTNPPFNLAGEFIARALKLARTGVAVLVRAQFSEGIGRWRDLYCVSPPQLEAQFVERLPMHKGRWVINGSSATAYMWLVWTILRPHDTLNRPGWRKVLIPPCRRRLTRHGDWLRFSGCVDLPKGHPAMKLQARAA